MAPVGAGAASVEKRCPISGKAGECPMMARSAKKAAKAAPASDAGAQAPGGEVAAAAPVAPARPEDDELRKLLAEGEEQLLKATEEGGAAGVKALKAFSRAMDLAPANEAACCGKIATMELLGRPRGALKASVHALRRLPGSKRLTEAGERIAAQLGDEAAEIAAEAWSEGEAAEGALAARDRGEDSAGEASDDGDAAACPASRTVAQAKKDMEAQKRRPRGSTALELALGRLDTEESVPFRQALKAELVSFYREFYAKTSTKNVDTSQYTKAEKSGLSIKDGHRHMPRPEEVNVPDEWKQPVGTLTAQELSKYNGQRLLVSIHGDIFDVSDRPDKYGPDGPYSSMAGHDITWAFWSGLDENEEWDKYYDLFQAQPREERDRRLGGLMSWWAFFEQEYGSPVGRLSVYDREWELKPPPAVKDLCTVM